MKRGHAAARAVVVTGASKGIGRATALALDRLGYRVFATVRREADGDALRAEATERLSPVLLDVTDARAIAAATGLVARESPDGVYGLVNNAGVVVAGPLEVLPLEEIRHQFAVNVFGPLALTQALLPAIREGRGRIVNVSSVNGRLVTPFVAPYAASKFALEALSDGLRMELARWRIPVVVIEPGSVRTPIWETSAARAQQNLERLRDEARARYGGLFKALARAGRPPDRAIPPERVARVIARALAARRPRTRYLVGWDGWLGALLALAPGRVRDFILLGRR